MKEKINGKTDDVETAKRALKAEIRRENNSVMFAANFSRLSPIEQNRETADFETLKIDAVSLFRIDFIFNLFENKLYLNNFTFPVEPVRSIILHTSNSTL